MQDFMDESLTRPIAIVLSIRLPRADDASDFGNAPAEGAIYRQFVPEPGLMLRGTC